MKNLIRFFVVLILLFGLSQTTLANETNTTIYVSVTKEGNFIVSKREVTLRELVSILIEKHEAGKSVSLSMSGGPSDLELLKTKTEEIQSNLNFKLGDTIYFLVSG